MIELTRSVLGQEIAARIAAQRSRLSEQWRATAPINHFVLDDVLPEEWTHCIREVLPKDDRMVVTSFRGTPEQPIRDLAPRADIWLRTALRSARCQRKPALLRQAARRSIEMNCLRCRH
jgi:hypothetical protein